MTDTSLPRLTLRQRLYRLRTSYRFPFVLFGVLFGVGGLSQAYCYWWGMHVEQMLMLNKAIVERGRIYPGWVKDIIGVERLRPLEPIQFVQFLPATSGNGPPTATAIRQLRGLYFLRELHVTGRMDDDALQELRQLTQLRIVYHYGPTLKSMEALAALPDLRKLTLPFDESLDLAMYEHVARIPKLETFDFWMTGNCQGRASVLESLRTVARSRTLRRIEGRIVHGDQLRVLTELLPDGTVPLPELRELIMPAGGSSSFVTDRDLDNIANLTRLEVLRIPDHVLTDEGISKLKELPQLHTLDLEVSRFHTDKGVAILASMTNLQSLNVSPFRVGLQRFTKSNMLALARLPKLRFLRMEVIDPKDQAEIRKLLPPGCVFDPCVTANNSTPGTE